METLKKIVRNQYFPAAAVLTAVLLFWIIAMFGGLSLLNNNQPPMATLTWMLFVYAAAVLTPLAGILAGVDLVRRWRRNRMYALVELEQDGTAEYEAAQEETLQDAEPAHEQVQEPATQAEAPAQPAEPEAPKQSAPKQPAQHRPVTQQQPVKRHPVQQQPAQQQPAKKQRKKAA
ncbi:outer membrane biosynthesis protein TonB [Arthrobacter sp. UYNi723]